MPSSQSSKRYEGRGRSARGRKTEDSARFSHRYVKSFGRQLFVASLCLIVVFFARDIDHPLVRQGRQALKETLTSATDFSRLGGNLRGFVQDWTNRLLPQEAPDSRQAEDAAPSAASSAAGEADSATAPTPPEGAVSRAAQ